MEKYMEKYYQKLGLNFGAGQDEVKKAFRKLAHIHHPDKGGCEAKFKEINEAYQIITGKIHLPQQAVQQQPFYGYTATYYYQTGNSFYYRF